ncbi:unnamed protein product [Paramecium sonneborni]|uniref:Uncharacterized protein n=1 Tax=Paramecium sonneborni TaxID=65129 RepID=A0A8S1M298_9CILI|nr:unnamed protein product [Paramecium sonneborni]
MFKEKISSLFNQKVNNFVYSYNNMKNIIYSKFIIKNSKDNMNSSNKKKLLKYYYQNNLQKIKNYQQNTTKQKLNEKTLQKLKLLLITRTNLRKYRSLYSKNFAFSYNVISLFNSKSRDRYNKLINVNKIAISTDYLAQIYNFKIVLIFLHQQILKSNLSPKDCCLFQIIQNTSLNQRLISQKTKEKLLHINFIIRYLKVMQSSPVNKVLQRKQN